MRKRTGLFRLGATDPRRKLPCENGAVYDFKTGKTSPCSSKTSTDIYFGFRWGDKAKGEPSIVDTETRYCDECAALVQESINEARAEADAS